MSFAYTHAKDLLMTGAINFASDDIRVMLVMTNTTSDTEEDVATIGAFTTLDQFDGTGYAAPGLALSGKSVNESAANNRAEFLASNTTFSTLGAGTRPIQAALVYKFVSSQSSSIPLFFVDTGGFPISANGGDVVLQWNAAGLLQAT